jgi:hypothetical protein
MVTGAGSCATSLATRQTARPLEQGHFSVELGPGFFLPLGTVARVTELGADLTGRLLEAVRTQTPYQLTPEEQQDLLTAGVALAVLPPSPAWDVSARAGVLPHLDAGLRYSINALRADAKVRLIEHVDDLTAESAARARSDVAVGIAVSRYLFKNPAFEVLEFVEMGDFSRWDVEVPLYISREWGETFRLYGAAKYLYSRTDLDERLVSTAEQAAVITGLDLMVNPTVHAHFIGASVGVKLGYRHLFVLLELTGGYTFASVRLAGQERSLSGPALYPALGLEVVL